VKSYMVIGLGRFGASVAVKLQELGHEVLVMDSSEELVQRFSNRVTYAVVGDARDEEVLRSLGAANFDCAIVGIGTDLAANILITLNLKALGVPQVICKAQNDMEKRALEKVGADRVVIPEWEMGLKLAQNLASSSVLDYIALSEGCGISELKTPKSWVGKNLRDLNVRAKYGVTVVALRRADGDVTVFLGPEYVLHEDDVLVLLGANDDLDRVQNL